MPFIQNIFGKLDI